MSELSKLPNVGKVLEENLLAVGIETPQQLEELGVQEAFLRIRHQQDPGACLHMLYGLQGAVLGIPDTLLTSETKQELKTFFKSLKK
ncbi:TfoX/Sxy family protein [uncultured Sphaerochaeta sp.]|uniref:TfoX/Sxy family protein n=1 Tax=uncultured Sphaerochaeta sp. TaxID=886478 RepID=UPI002A0A0F87|nr:TfoX/Sxy family protein [uncultured Sphaerochaeta sp.]